MDFFQILVVASPGSYARMFFELFEKKIFDFFFLRIFFVFVKMGPYGSENFKMLLLLQMAPESFQLFLNFLPNGLHKTTFGIFEILNLWFLTFFFRT